MARVYERKFDWDEARRLRDEGWSYAAIAAKVGVSDSAVWQVLTGVRRTKEYRARSREAQRRLYRGVGACIDCGGPTWGGPHAHPRCTDCAAKVAAVTVRPDALRCRACGEWKPHALFPYDRTKRARRGRHSDCRACQARVRQNYRERIKVPCELCGEPALPPSEKGPAGRARALCLQCYRASDEFRAMIRRGVEASARKRRRAAA